MSDVTPSLVAPDDSLRKAIETIDTSAGKIALVVDGERRLLGTVTDGDIRRGLLSGVAMERPVSEVMNRHPRVAGPGDDKATLLERMRRERVRQLPLVDTAGRLVGLETLAELLQTGRRDNWVVLMAGGEGRRLRPLTSELPKPMLPVGPKPILETIVDSFVDAGFHRFFISVNYKAESIERHFGDGAARNVQIRYLRESHALGTAGALGLLPERPAAPLIVMNGDILTKVDFGQVLDFHRDHDAVATMCVREYGLQVPYGVVQIDGHRLTAIEEKPTIRHFVNAGIYVLEPEVLDEVEPDTPTTMPRLFERLLAKGTTCSVCPVREYWLDVGRMTDFERANAEFAGMFDD